MESFEGYHSEWNLGSPGGWDYQRITQQIGRASWERVRLETGIDVELDFDHPLLNPMPGFLEMLLRAHQQRHGRGEAFVVAVAEEETLDTVVENQNLVKALGRMDGVTSALCAPHELELSGERVCYRGREATLVFVDFNTDTMLRIHDERHCAGLLAAVRQGLVVNPRGMESINSKGVFELVTETFRDQLSPETIARTPWTRRFYPRKTTGPDGATVEDLVDWVCAAPDQFVLKPAHGYSGHGVFVGVLRENWDKDVETALREGDYIVQELVPLNLWGEEQPWLDHEARSVVIRQWQTDFRCLITDKGLIGFVGRFGGVPTNVGSGGGVQAIALLKSAHGVGEATRRINDAVCSMGYEKVVALRQWMDQQARESGLVYLLGPIMTALRPRLITSAQLDALTLYARGIWNDCQVLEELWRNRELAGMLQDARESEAIYRCQAWQGSPALIAADGLFGFGA